MFSDTCGKLNDSPQSVPCGKKGFTSVGGRQGIFLQKHVYNLGALWVGFPDPKPPLGVIKPTGGNWFGMKFA